MTGSVRDLVTSFESLPKSEQHEAALEILKRAGLGTAGDIEEDVLVGAGDKLFCQMDEEEAPNAAS
jgi:hypothetical protein